MRSSHAVSAALSVAVATPVYLSARASGAYFPSAWPLLAAAVLLPTLALLIVGRRPGGWVAAAALALFGYGGWSLLSVTWGGIPDIAWTTFDQSALGAAALVLGSLLAGRRAQWVVVGVVAGITAEAVEVLYRLQAGPVPSDWFDGRKVQGPVGYANAQGAIFAVGVPLALWLASRPRVAVRVAGGAAAVVLVGALLLTQSRGALLALAIALVVQIALARDIRLLSLALGVGLCGALLWVPLHHVDRALVSGTTESQTAAFRDDVRWVVLGAAVLALLAALPPRKPALRRALLVSVVGVIVAAAVAVPVVRPGTLHDLRGAITGPEASAEPANLPAGETRLTSISFTGRLTTWRIAWRLYERHPVLGAGKGTYARAWDRERPNHNLSVLQPHSLELEALSELGALGALAILCFVMCALVALFRARSRRNALPAAGVAVILVLLLQASVDWTFSFPALVVASLLVVGVAAGPGPRRTTGLAVHAGLTVIALTALVAYEAPYMAARKLGQAERALAHDPALAWTIASRARSYDRWNPEVVDLQARAAAATGHLALSASLYSRAAELAQRPWMEEAARAEVLRQAGREAASRAACRAALADNPLEITLRTVCAGVSP